MEAVKRALPDAVAVTFPSGKLPLSPDLIFLATQPAVGSLERTINNRGPREFKMGHFQHLKKIKSALAQAASVPSEYDFLR